MLAQTTLTWRIGVSIYRCLSNNEWRAGCRIFKEILLSIFAIRSAHEKTARSATFRLLLLLLLLIMDQWIWWHRRLLMHVGSLLSLKGDRGRGGRSSWKWIVFGWKLIHGTFLDHLRSLSRRNWLNTLTDLSFLEHCCSLLILVCSTLARWCRIDIDTPKIDRLIRILQLIYHICLRLGTRGWGWDWGNIITLFVIIIIIGQGCRGRRRLGCRLEVSCWSYHSPIFTLKVGHFQLMIVITVHS